MNRLIAAVIVVLLISRASYGTQPFTPGNILVIDVFLGSSTANSSFISEYTRTGALVQTISVPAIYPTPNSEWARDPVVDQAGNLQIFNGTFAARLSSFNPVTGSWHNSGNFSIYNDASTGKLASFGHYVFATDGYGITRIDTNDDSSIEFGGQGDRNYAPIDITLGYDGFLYSLYGAGNPSGQFIQVFDPSTLQFIRKIATPYPPTSIVVDASGFIYLNKPPSGPIYKLTPDGQIIDSARYDCSNFADDVDLSADGTFMITQYDGVVTMLDSNLQEIRTFTTLPGHHMSFGAFINVPEPSSLILLGFGALFSLARCHCWLAQQCSVR